MKHILELIKIARPGFWPTHLWFFCLPFATRDMFSNPSFWLGAVYVCFPLSLLIYGWNDLGDAISDEANERKDSWLFGARPDSKMRSVLPFWMGLVQVPFIIAFVILVNWQMLVWFSGVVLINFTYNTLRFKSLPLLDLLNQVGYLLIFVMASWLCDVPQLNAPAMVFSTLFAMQSHLFGQIMDIDADKVAGRKSTAVVIGALRAKLLLIFIMTAEVVIAYIYFRTPIVAIFMSAGVLFFIFDAAFGPRRYPVWFMKIFFVGWNLMVIATIHFVWRYGVFLVN
ncbi:UbiA family prenyltransferase [Candidatus Uabimicrobium sp. HlEnr_7]|uniref:UbiA family prenyltransferase n=1 Tax=Candidatus Uabimicrobium helgolandensis TaxID=3095367 RepID=UPI003556227F